jgi:hypothetical protein
MPKGPVETPITDQEIAFAHLVLAGKLTDREAAEAVGMDPGRAAYVKAKPRVKTYMEEHRASVRVGLVQHEVDALAEFNIGREQILAKWWEFASIDPAKTGYNTTGQSKALDSLWKGLGFDGSKNPGQDELKPEPPNIYHPPWLLERQRGIFRERDECPEPELSSSEPPTVSAPARTDRGGEVAQSMTLSPSGYRANRAIEPAEPPYKVPGSRFGRFQGM